MPVNLIILFAKAPIPGRVKTRLIPAISPDAAAELHSAFVTDMIERFRGLEGTDFELHTDTRTDEWSHTGVTRKIQISGDLGLKMIHALESGLTAGYERVLVLGSDAPTLPLEHVRGLLQAKSDIVLGPAEDGGFYAIGAGRIHSAMFDDVAWSQPNTLAKAMDAIRRCGLTVEVGPTWYDVDEPAELERLRSQTPLPQHTAVWFSRAISEPKGT